MIFNEVTSSYGTGINPVIPGHDVESLKIAQNYNLEKSGVVNIDGKLKDVGVIFSGLSVLNEKTNELVIKTLESENALFRSFKY